MKFRIQEFHMLLGNYMMLNFHLKKYVKFYRHGLMFNVTYGDRLFLIVKFSMWMINI
jgi:hypothetical protein